MGQVRGQLVSTAFPSPDQFPGFRPPKGNALHSAESTPRKALDILAVTGQSKKNILLEQTLDTLDFSYRLVQNEADAVRAALWFRPKLILMELGRLRGDKVRVVEFVRILEAWSKEESVRIIAITDSGAPEQRKSYLASGVDDCLVKPYTPERLAAMLQGWLMFHEITEKGKSLKKAVGAG